MGKPQPSTEAPVGPVRACDIEPIFAAGQVTMRYRGVTVWAVCQSRKPVPLYGVVALNRAQAGAFVVANRGRNHGLDIRPLTAEDLAGCSVYFDGRNQPIPDEDERPGDLPGQRRMF